MTYLHDSIGVRQGLFRQVALSFDLQFQTLRHVGNQNVNQLTHSKHNVLENNALENDLVKIVR